MKFAFITFDGTPFPVAYRLQKEGNEVLVGQLRRLKDYHEEPECMRRRLSLYDGLLDKRPAEVLLRELMNVSNKDEFFIFVDHSDLWECAEMLLAAGFTKGIFPTKFYYTLEKEREVGKDFVRRHYPKLKVAEVHVFNRAAEGVQFIHDSDEVWVLKSNGNYADSVVPCSNDTEIAHEEVITALEEHRADYERGGFSLERKIRNALEITPIMAFYDGIPLYSVVEFENKPIGAGNIGAPSGGIQNLMVETTLNAPINKIAFPPIVYSLARRQPGLAIFDAGLMWDKKDFYFLEFAGMRWGLDGMFSDFSMAGDALRETTFTDYFTAVADAESPHKWLYGTAVRMINLSPDPEFPDMYEDGLPLHWPKSVDSEVQVYRMRKEKGKLVNVGYSMPPGLNDLLCTTGYGDSIQDAADVAYQAMEKVAFQDGHYRPKFDFLSKDYSSSIISRYNACNHVLFESLDFEEEETKKDKEEPKDAAKEMLLMLLEGQRKPDDEGESETTEKEEH